MNATENTTAAAETITLPETCDPEGLMLDMANDYLCESDDVNKAAKRRQTAMNAAHRAGHEGCEMCGRALKTGHVAVLAADGRKVASVGPGCAERIRKMLAAG